MKQVEKYDSEYKDIFSAPGETKLKLSQRLQVHNKINLMTKKVDFARSVFLKYCNS